MPIDLSYLLLAGPGVSSAAEAGSLAGTDMALAHSKALAMLFLMLGPFKVLVPFVTLTSALDRRQQVRTATVAVSMAAIILAIAGLLGRAILDNFDISLPVLSLTGGLILFLMALRTVMPESVTGQQEQAQPTGYGRSTAINPLAFPVIVTPYGLAAVIVFTALSQGDPGATAMIATIVAATLAVDWFAMLYAGAILARFGTALQVIAIILGVVQTALGLQIIVRSLELLGIIEGLPK